MTRIVTFLTGVVILVACAGSPGPAPNHPGQPRDTSRAPASLGAPRRVGDWNITVLGSTLEPPGGSAHEKYVPTGPLFRGDLRFFVILQLVRVAPGTAAPAQELDVETSGQSGVRYRSGQGPACRGAGDLVDVPSPSPEVVVRAELCFSIDPDDADSLLLTARSRPHPATPTHFYLQATSH